MPSAFVNSEAKVARVLLADDHAEILSRTASALADEFEIVGSVANVVDLVKAAAQFDPDVVVLDITMPGLDGIEAARRLKESGCRAKLIFLTMHEDLDCVGAALQSGGIAYVIKARLASDLVPAIHQTLADHCFVSPTIVSNPADHALHRKQQ